MIETKQLKEAISDALVPHIVGVRNDLEDGRASAEEKAAEMTDSVVRAIAELSGQFSGAIESLARAVQANAERPLPAVEVTNRIEVTIENADSVTTDDETPQD